MAWLGDVITEFAAWLLSIVEGWVWFLVCKIEPIVAGWFDDLVALIPASWKTDLNSSLSTMQTYFGFANWWFPLDVAFAVLAALILFHGTFITIKIILKLVPTVG